MELALYIQIKAQDQIAFGFPLSAWLKEQFPDITLVDADNFSDDLVINQELKMIKEADRCLLLVDIAPEIKPGKSIRLLEAVLRDKREYTFIQLNGSNTTFEKMLKLCKAEFSQNLTEEELKQAILS